MYCKFIQQVIDSQKYLIPASYYPLLIPSMLQKIPSLLLRGCFIIDLIEHIPQQLYIDKNTHKEKEKRQKNNKTQLATTGAFSHLLLEIHSTGYSQQMLCSNITVDNWSSRCSTSTTFHSDANNEKIMSESKSNVSVPKPATGRHHFSPLQLWC